MPTKIIALFTIFFACLSTLQAAPLKFDNFDAIKSELLQGGRVKTVIDFGKCEIVAGNNNGRGMKNIVGLMIENFMISDRTKGIHTSHNFLNSIDKSAPYAAAGYRVGDVAIMPNQDVYVETAIIRLPDLKILGAIRLLCKMNDGANFYQV